MGSSRQPPTPWKYTLRRALSEFSADGCTDIAATLTYHMVFAIFPGLLALISILGVVGESQSTTAFILDFLRQLGQSDVAEQLSGPIDNLASKDSAGFALIIGVLGALWSASGYVGSFGRAMNKIYDIREGRPIWTLRAVNLVVTFIVVVSAAIVLAGLALSGPIPQAIGQQIGVGELTVTIWNWAKWPIILLVMIFIVALLYYATPNVKQPRFRLLSAGAAAAILIWIVASVGLGFYVGNFGKYDATYGSLAGVIIFLLWMWVTNVALLLGAELDVEMERTRELKQGIKAEEKRRLTLRDRRGLVKTRKKRERLVDEGKEIRELATGRWQPLDAQSAPPGPPPDPTLLPEPSGLEPLPSTVARRRGY